VDRTGTEPTWTTLDASLPGEVVYRVDSPYPIVGGSVDATFAIEPGGGRIDVYAARFVEDVQLTGNELAYRGYRVPGLFVTDSNLATYVEDGLFPVVHTAVAHQPASITFRLVPRSRETPLIVGGTFYRATEADQVALAVSKDASTWQIVWQAGPDAVGYFTHGEDVTALANGDPLYARVEVTAHTYGATWTAGFSDLRLDGVDLPIERLVWTSDETALTAQRIEMSSDISEAVAPPLTAAVYSYLVRVVAQTAFARGVSVA
jgi:hypothetical protein